MKFSPLTDKTFEFIESCCKDKLKPIFIITPSKKNLALSISIKTLQKRWIEDLNNQSNPYVPGDKINIKIPPNLIKNKNTINLFAEVVSTNQSQIKLNFNSDENSITYELNINWINKYGQKANNKIRLSKGNFFIDKFKSLRKSDITNNPWVKFLGVNYPITNSQLQSKVYLIVGRGSVELTRKRIDLIGLNETLKEGLIIKENLNVFNESLGKDLERQSKIDFFIDIFNDEFGSNFDPEEDYLKHSLGFIRRVLNEKKINLTELKKGIDQFLYDLIKADYSEEYQILKNIIIENLPDESLNQLDISLVKSIIIDGTEIAIENSNTIKKLISLNIPIIFLSNYANYTKESKSLIRSFFNDFQEIYCFNWNRVKINSLETITENTKFIDNSAYYLCKKYLFQKVIIEAFNDNSNIIDKFFNAFEIHGLLRRIEGFEGVKNAYTVFLRPVIYQIKNVPGQIEITEDLINSVRAFQITYDLIKNQLNAQATEIANLLDEFLDLFSENKREIENSKKIENLPENSIYFNQSIKKLQNNELKSPNYSLENFKTQTLVFTGTPSEEMKYFYLRKALFETFDNVHFLGFCREAENINRKFVIDTTNFNFSITDDLPMNYVPFWDPKCDLDNQIAYKKEKCSGLNFDNELPLEDFDEIQNSIEISKYQFDDRDFLTGENPEKESKVAVNILELEGNKSVFLKKKGARKLLVLKRNNILDDRGDWDHINPGDRIFTYIITRQDTLEMRGENTVNESVFQDLDIWYLKLKDLYNAYNQNSTDLAKFLNNLKNKESLAKSNPEPANLRNWLHKNRIINAPEEENCWLILSAAKTVNIKEEIIKIKNAKKKIEKQDKSNRENIKIQIQKFIQENTIEDSDSFSVNVNSVPIIVNHGVVKHKMETDNLKMDQDKIGIILTYNKSNNGI